ncbi:MAG: PHB depolymerase family esterase [Vitreoscilla sp.]|nr:PHB depolymerase family esterase [Polaromonas sp.]
MAKSLSSLWLKGLRRLGRVQQSQGKKILKSLLPKPARSSPVRRARPRPAAKPVNAATRIRPEVRKRTATALLAGGTWQQYYFSPSGLASTSPVRRMAYWLYLPKSIAQPTAGAKTDASSKPLPLVVMLHGCQQTAADFATATRMNALAERKGFAVLYPQQSASADAHRCWHWFQRRTQQGQGDTGLLAQLMAQVQTRHGLDATRIYVAGLSAGAALAALLALRFPDTIAAIGLHSAPVFGVADSAIAAYRVMQYGAGAAAAEAAQAALDAVPLLSDKAGMPVILLHGQRDAVVRRINLDQLAQQFQIINAGGTTRAEPVHRSYPARSGGRSPRRAWQTSTLYAGRKPQVVRCEITGLGHAWSGGDDSVAFSAREGPDAALMMWHFFTHHRRTPITPGGAPAPTNAAAS